jgi:hypothetical protein
MAHELSDPVSSQTHSTSTGLPWALNTYVAVQGAASLLVFGRSRDQNSEWRPAKSTEDFLCLPQLLQANARLNQGLFLPYPFRFFIR